MLKQKFIIALLRGGRGNEKCAVLCLRNCREFKQLKGFLDEKKFKFFRLKTPT